MRFRIDGFDDPKRVVHGRVVLPERGGGGPFPFVVCVHGYSGHCEWGFWPELSRRLGERGVASVRFNHSGSGIREDLVTFEDRELFGRSGYLWELEDLERVRALAVSGRWPLDPARAAIVGHSRGGAMAIVHAVEAGAGAYRGIVSWAGIDAILRFSRGRLAQWRRDGGIQVRHHLSGGQVWLDRSVLESAERNRARLDVLAACGRLTCPLLVVQGTADESVDVRSAHNLVGASRVGELFLVDGADHVFSNAREQVVERTVEWLHGRL